MQSTTICIAYTFRKEKKKKKKKKMQKTRKEVKYCKAMGLKMLQKKFSKKKISFVLLVVAFTQHINSCQNKQQEDRKTSFTAFYSFSTAFTAHKYCT